MAEQFHVFISYTQDDGEIAASVASALGDLGLKPFLAEKEISLGMHWEDYLRQAIRQSSVILCLITPRSKRSAWVHAEAGAAWVLEKPIVPAFFEVDPNELIEILRLRNGRKIDSPDKLELFLRDLATLVSKVSRLPLIKRISRPITGEYSSESFTEEDTWTNLLKIGAWSRDELSGLITGRGIHNYLLSSNHYTPPISINSLVRFLELHGTSKLDAVNAGVVFGWTTPNNVRRYFNLLINEERIWLELIGSRGGDAYLDYHHIDGGVPFLLRVGVLYNLSIAIGPGVLALTVSDQISQRWEYITKLPELAHGRVGLRPWRSRMNCERYEVTQL